jgi:hypothetical protein
MLFLAIGAALCVALIVGGAVVFWWDRHVWHRDYARTWKEKHAAIDHRRIQ